MMAIPLEPSSAGATLRELSAVLGATLSGDGSVVVRDVRHDSRKVQPGDLFVARAGSKSDGASFAKDAVARGARAIMVDSATVLSDLGVPVLTVKDIRLGIALAAEAVWGHPSRALGVVGITGTNGKTTSSFLIQHAVDCAGGKAARLGTLGFGFEGEIEDSPLTTPEADQVSRYAASVRDRGGTHLVMEVSSHALMQCRVEALRFEVAVFTNLTQDHLDFHGSMAAYAAAKLRLFTELSPAASVVNVDDAFGAEVARQAKGRVLRVSKRDPSADVHPEAANLDARGITGRIRVGSGAVELESRLVGEHNLDNLLTALAVVEALDLDVARAAEGMKSAPMVPGRLERCDAPEDDLVVLVDYAHTPDALERALVTSRSLTAGEVVCVFGCGGDRDPLKRPKMGDAVGRLASRAIVTNDNPRSEEPKLIADAIVGGLAPHAIPFDVELDRALAIERAVLASKPGDVVLIAGKGHEPYQIVGTVKRAFDDRVEARRALALRRAR